MVKLVPSWTFTFKLLWVLGVSLTFRAGGFINMKKMKRRSYEISGYSNLQNLEPQGGGLEVRWSEVSAVDAWTNLYREVSRALKFPLRLLLLRYFLYFSSHRRLHILTV